MIVEASDKPAPSPEPEVARLAALAQDLEDLAEVIRYRVPRAESDKLTAAAAAVRRYIA